MRKLKQRKWKSKIAAVGSTLLLAASFLLATPSSEAVATSRIAAAQSSTNRNFTVNGAPRIHGNMRVGQTVEVVGRNGVFSPAPTGWRYQWFRGDQPIPGATNRRYTIRQADADRLLSVQVTAIRSGFSNSTVRTPSQVVTRRGDGTRNNPYSFGHIVNLDGSAGRWRFTPRLEYARFADEDVASNIVPEEFSFTIDVLSSSGNEWDMLSFAFLSETQKDPFWACSFDIMADWADRQRRDILVAHPGAAFDEGCTPRTGNGQDVPIRWADGSITRRRVMNGETTALLFGEFLRDESVGFSHRVFNGWKPQLLRIENNCVDWDEVLNEPPNPARAPLPSNMASCRPRTVYFQIPW